ncbi:MAG: BlaI/MecI/CopY family transcriptional regulator [Phycisphaerae bacterium]|nr:BlaI/MecI/CopY family transcriptional regulator [Phycisphaerae bacterium]
MAKGNEDHLSRRERQIMDVLYSRQQASVADVRRELPDPPSYSAVRALMRILEDKGHLHHRKDGPRYLYIPTQSRRQAGRSAARRLLETFFDGSASKAMAAFLEAGDAKNNPAELDRLAKLIDQAREEGR